MTREEFINGVSTWDELINFCGNYGYGGCSNLYSDEDKNDYIDDRLIELATESDCWQDLLCDLQNIPTGYDWYILDDWGRLDFAGADDEDFAEAKDDALEWGDDNDVWDDEFEENDTDVVEYNHAGDEDEDIVVDEGCSINELFMAGVSYLQTIGAE